MKTLLYNLSIAAIALVLAGSLGSIQAVQVYGEQDPHQQPPAGQTERMEQMFVGELEDVDTDTRIITVRGPDDKEMEFSYDDQTLVIGAVAGLQGLASETGEKVRVHFKEELGVNQATRIVILQEDDLDKS